MKAVLFENQTIIATDLPVPHLKAGEALVRPMAAGICNTDIELFNGYYAFQGIPGHEFVGTIESSPDRPEWEGERIVADINCGCGVCSWCLAGNRRHCPSRKVIGIRGWDGAFAEYLKVPLTNIHRVDSKIPNEAAVFAEPLAAALEISQQVHLTHQHRMVVLGDGKLGLLTALALRHYNPDITLVGKHAAKLAIAAAQHVATFQIGTPEELPDLPRQLGLFDIVVEATGSPDGVNHALQLTKPEGTLVAKTTSHLPSQLDLAKLVVDEIQVLGSRCGDLALALAFLKNNWIDVEPLIDAVYPFEEFETAFERARWPGAKKFILAFNAR